MVLDRLRRRGRQLLAPQRVGDRVGADRARRVAREKREEPAALRARDMQLVSVVLDDKRTENQDADALDFDGIHASCHPRSPREATFALSANVQQARLGAIRVSLGVASLRLPPCYRRSSLNAPG